MSAAPPLLIEHFGPLARDYDALLCDVWGVVHNGLAAFPETVPRSSSSVRRAGVWF